MQNLQEQGSLPIDLGARACSELSRFSESRSEFLSQPGAERPAPAIGQS